MGSPAEERIGRLRGRLGELGVPGALISNPQNVGYLSGFSGTTAVLLVTADRAVFITDFRYQAQSERECPGFERRVIRSSGAYHDATVEAIRKLGVDRLAVEGDFVTVEQFRKLEESLEEIQLQPVGDLVGALRRIKDEVEIERTRAACAIVDRVFESILELLRPGVAEREVALELDYRMRKEGSEKEGFETIVASGARSALPHGRASDKRLERGDFVTLDFGARVGGYHSDLTRTVVLGPADQRQREVYQVVLEAQVAALEAIRAGEMGRAMDSVARDRITARGHGEHFGHGLGHGLGRTCHDHPALSQTSELKLESGMIMTVEPGVYIEGWGGVRIEDDVLVTETGCEILTHAPKHLIELPV